MALKDAFLGEQTTTSTGSSLTLITATTGKRNFADTHGIGDTFLGIVHSQDKSVWESGIFTVASLNPTVLTRPATPIDSSSASASVTLPAGTQTVMSVAIPANLLPAASGNIDFHGARITNAIFTVLTSTLSGGDFVNSAESDVPSGSNYLINGIKGGYYKINLTADSNLFITNGILTFPANKMCRLTLIITQDATGGRILGLPDSFLPHGERQSIPTNANSVTIINAVSLDGINWTYWVEPITPFFPVNPSMLAITGTVSINADTRNGVVLHEAADNIARTWTVASDALYPVGSSTRLLGQAGSGVITLAMTGADTLTLAPAGTTGSRTLTAPFDATLTKITATDWMISGVGIT